MAKIREPKPQTKSIFDFFNDIFLKKTSWEDLSESDKKAFSPYMTNRWISMESDYIGIVNYFQRYTIGLLAPREVYRLYLDLFPKKKFFVKYIKANKDKEDKISTELVKFLSRNCRWSEYETEQNLGILLETPQGKKTVIEYIQGYGFTEAEVKSKFKLK